MSLKLAESGMLATAARLKSNAPRTAAIKHAMGRCQVSLGAIVALHTANANKTELSAEGRRMANRKGLSDAFAEILRSTATATAHRAKLDAWQLRNRTLPACDKSDFAAAIGESEGRAVLRSLPPGERLNAALADPSVLAAALRGSDLASGLTTEMRKTLTDHFVASDPARAKAAADIEETRDALDHLTATVDFLRAAVGTVGEFDHHAEFGAFMNSAIGDRAAGIEAEAARAVDSMGV